MANPVLPATVDDLLLECAAVRKRLNSLKSDDPDSVEEIRAIIRRLWAAMKAIDPANLPGFPKGTLYPLGDKSLQASLPALVRDMYFEPITVFGERLDLDAVLDSIGRVEGWCREHTIPALEQTIRHFAAKNRPLADEGAKNDPELATLTVELSKKTITMAGKTWPVTSEQALRWVKVLADNPGKWIASGDLKLYDKELDEVRTDKLQRFLPKKIARLIESQPGVGSRFSLP